MKWDEVQGRLQEGGNTARSPQSPELLREGATRLSGKSCPADGKVVPKPWDTVCLEHSWYGRRRAQRAGEECGWEMNARKSRRLVVGSQIA